MPHNSEEQNIKIISVCGCARKDKSTFLNCIISFLLQQNTKVFNTPNNDEHCTSGIDYASLSDHKLLFLDTADLMYHS